MSIRQGLNIRHLLCTALLLFVAQQSRAQGSFVSRFDEVQAGFFFGEASYFGDLNPLILGDRLQFADGTSPTESWRSGQYNFGTWAKVPLGRRFNVRAMAGFGNLTYTDDVSNYQMQTDFRELGLGLELLMNPGGVFVPYLTLGVSSMRFQLPEPISHLELEPYTTGVLQSTRRTTGFPVGIGFQYYIAERAAIFVEGAFMPTQTDELDNLSTPAVLAAQRYSNDAISSIRVGMNVSIVKVFEFFRDAKKIPRQAKAEPVIRQDLNLTSNFAPPFMLLPEDSLLRAYSGLVADSLQELGVDDDQMADLAQVSPAPTPPPGPVPTPVIEAPRPIPVVEPENRQFDEEKELERIREIQEERRQMFIDRGETPPARDPYVPVIMIRPKPISSDIIVDGFVTSSPPPGYYVQVFATVGPITAQRNRKTTMDILADVLENPERQVIITKRKQFYEVRIGVFDTYDDTIQVLERVQGTYLDAYTLIYLRDQL